MASDLATMNVLLGVMAAVSVLEALALVGVAIGSFVAYRRMARALAAFETKHVAPAAARVSAILDDAKKVTSAVTGAASAADTGVRSGLAWIVRWIRTGRRAA